MDAMTTMGMDTDEQSDVIQVASGNFGIKYLSSIDDNNQAYISKYKQ